MLKNPKFAIVLAGCGRADGSEIHEATCAMLAVDCAGCTYRCFAPDIDQSVVINHLTGERTAEKRSVLVEAARLARGDILPLRELNVNDFDGVIFPGGLGAVVNWCDFMKQGATCHVDESIRRVLTEAYRAKRVIGAMCIAPVLIAKVLGEHHIKVTVGNDPKTAAVVVQFGAEHEICTATKACVDTDHKIVTTPAYMLADSIKEVYAGAVCMVEEMIKLTERE
jgi:enhancing lycopene biosynthesis protein 2